MWCTQKSVLSKVLMLTLFGSVTVFITAKYLPLVGNLRRELTLLYVHLICMLLFLGYNWIFCLFIILFKPCVKDLWVSILMFLFL